MKTVETRQGRGAISSLLSVVAGALLALGCSPVGGEGPSGAPPVEGVLGPAGGTLELTQVGSVVVGAGSLTAPVAVRAAVVEAPAPLPGPAASPVLELTPHGTTFSIPARVSLRYASTAPASSLRVLRLADAADTTWEPVGGVRFSGGVATFDTVGFSYYVVLEGGSCELVATPTACSADCECCGTSACVNVATDAANCGGCGVACDANSYCASGSTCRRAGPASLCANRQLYVVRGQIPDLTVVNPEQTTDGLYADRLAAAIAGACEGVTVRTVFQAEPGLLDPCTDAPLVGGGTTLLVTGGTFSQRIARYLEASVAPVVQEVSEDNSQYTYFTRSGQRLVSFPRATLTDSHDYFVLAFERDPAHGAHVFQVFGEGWEGTPAATWYFEHRVLPAIVAGTIDWQDYIFVEWTDDGDGLKGEGDRFSILAQDLP